MKRTLALLLSLAAAFILTACATSTGASGGSIQPFEPSKEQKEVTDLIYGNDPVPIFEYELGKGYSSVEVKVVEYRDGAINDYISSSWLALDSSSKEGYILLSYDENGFSDYSYEIVDNGGTGQGKGYFGISDVSFKGHGIVMLENQMDIQPGKEIVLRVDVFKNGDSMGLFHDVQDYVDNYDLLDAYDYAIITICKFS